MFNKIKDKTKQLKKQITVVYLAYLHKEVKWYIKAFLILILIYALSPIDLIPDFIPILGLLDDILIIPLGIIIAMKMIPNKVWEECKVQAEENVQIGRKYKIAGTLLIVLIWILILYSIIKIII